MEEGKVRWRRGKCGGGGESEVEEGKVRWRRGK